jgi:hypothetical protein
MNSKRSSRIRSRFVLEQLDERVVLSSFAAVSFDHLVQVPAHLGQLNHRGTVTPSAHRPAGHPTTANHTVAVDHSQTFVYQPVATPPSRTAHPRSSRPFGGEAISDAEIGFGTPVIITQLSVASLPSGPFHGAQPTSSSPQSTQTEPANPRPTDTVTQSPPTTGSQTSYPDLDRLGQSLEQLFVAFEQGGISSANTVARADRLQIQQDSVLVEVTATGGIDVPIIGWAGGTTNVDQLVGQLDRLGMQVGSTNPITGLVVGSIPIAQLGNLSELTDTSSISPAPAPVPY